MPEDEIETMVRAALRQRTISADKGISRSSLGGRTPSLSRAAASLVIVLTVSVICGIWIVGDKFNHDAHVQDSSSSRDPSITSGSLIGIHWALNSITIGPDADMINAPESVFIEFTSNSYYIYDSCNGTSGTYTADTLRIHFQEAITAMMGCAEPASLALRDVLTAPPSEGLNLIVSDTSLTISRAGVVTATFRNAGAPTVP